MRHCSFFFARLGWKRAVGNGRGEEGAPDRGVRVDSKIEAISRDIVTHCLHILFSEFSRDTPLRRETLLSERADFRASRPANARLLVKSGGIAILFVGSVVPAGRTRYGR